MRKGTPEEQRAARRVWYHSNGKSKSKQRDRELQLKFGISLAQYERMLEDRKGLCDVCHQPEKSRRQKQLAVDHDHESGRIRGLLCTRCNVGVGMFLDNPELLIAAAQYLKGGLA